ncbi:MAG: SBBP repeat-containing protein [Candidatus Kapaibacterium sp.]
MNIHVSFLNKPLSWLTNLLVVLCVLPAMTLVTVAQEPTWQWAKNGGGTGSDAGTAITTDASNNIYTCGRFSGYALFGSTPLTSAGQSDVVVARFNASGACLWAVKGGGTGNDEPNAITTDDSGNVYVTGFFTGTATFGAATLVSTGGKDVFVVKYNAAGVVQWARRGGSVGNEAGNSIAVDANRNIYITGVYSDSTKFGNLAKLTPVGQSDIFLVQYNATGTEQWSKTIGGTDSDVGSDIAADAAGVYLSGNYNGVIIIGTDTLTSRGNTDAFVAKFTTGGAAQWARSGGGIGIDAAVALALDASGNVIVTGTMEEKAYFGTDSATSAGNSDVFLVKYSTGGAFQWLKRGGGADADYAQDLAVDINGNSFITGFFGGATTFGSRSVTSAGQFDVFVVKYSSSGAMTWLQRGGGSDFDFPYGVAADKLGNTFVIGDYFYQTTFWNTTLNGLGNYDFFLARLPDISANDAGITAINFPTAPFPQGAAAVTVTLKNFGTNQIDSVRINWTFNGAPQAAVVYRTALGVGQTATVALGSPNFPAKTFSEIVATTTLPNNTVDVNEANDGRIGLAGPGLARGVYTLGGAVADFPAFTQAAQYLNACGVLDSVIIDVRPGYYQEQVRLTQIPGAAALKKVIFRQEPKTASKPIVSFGAIYPNNNAVLLLDGTDWIVFKNINFISTGTQYAQVVSLKNGTTNVWLDSNVIETAQGALNDGGLISDNLNLATNLSITNNIFTNGVFGASLEYLPGAPMNGVTVSGNTFTNYLSVGAYIQGADAALISRNSFSTTSTLATALQVSSSTNNTQVVGNSITNTPSGIGISIFGASASSPALAMLVANNMVGIGNNGSSSTGIEIMSSSFANVYHNTVNIGSTATDADHAGLMVNSGGNIHIKNNIFYNSGGGYAMSVMFAAPDLAIASSDNNVLYSNGAYLGAWDNGSALIKLPTLKAWRDSTALDANSISKVLTFQNDLLHLVNVDSTLFGTTSLLSIVKTDFDRQPRRTPYMGADEIIPVITITNQTGQQFVCMGNTVVFSVDATISNNGRFRYQWQRNGVNIPDSTRRTLTVYNSNFDSEGFYRCVLIGNSGADTVITQMMQLAIAPTTKVFIQPKTVYLLPGSNATFEVGAEAAPILPDNRIYYSWYRGTTKLVNTTRFAGTDTPILQIFNVQPADTGRNYYAIVEGTCGRDTSQMFAVLLPGATFTKQPKDTAACNGGSVILSASLQTEIPNALLRYQWMRGNRFVVDTGNFRGSTTPTLTITNVTPADTGSDYILIVTVVANNSTLVTNYASVRLNKETVITDAPRNQASCEGKPVTLSATADGSGLSYQWQRNDVNIPGATSASYTIPKLDSMTIGAYRIVVTGLCGTQTSGAATVSKRDKPGILLQPLKRVRLFVGKLLTIAMEPSGALPLRYKWYKNGVEIPSSGEKIFYKNDVALADTGVYYCVISNDCDSIRTDNVEVYFDPTAVHEVAEVQGFMLESPQPNPVENSAVIRFVVPTESEVRISLRNALGQEVMTIANARYTAGEYSVELNPASTQLPAGVYFTELKSGNARIVRSTVIIR